MPRGLFPTFLANTQRKEMAERNRKKEKKEKIKKKKTKKKKCVF